VRGGYPRLGAGALLYPVHAGTPFSAATPGERRVNGMGCTQAELAVLLEAVEEKIEQECGDRIKPCWRVVKTIINDLREHGKEYVRAKYGL